MNSLSLVIGPFNVLGIEKDKKQKNLNHSNVAPKTRILPLGGITTIAPFDSPLRVETMPLGKSFEVAWFFGTLASKWKPLVRLLLA